MSALSKGLEPPSPADLSPDVEHVEIDASHLGLTLSPEVYAPVARRLAAPRAPGGVPAEPLAV